jgi:hypothetical protein
MMNLAQLAVFAFFVKRVHDCGAAGWGGAVARVFGWTLLSGFLAVLLVLFAGLALAAVVGRAVIASRKSGAPASAGALGRVFKAGTLDLAEPYALGVQALILVAQVLLLLRFTRCA